MYWIVVSQSSTIPWYIYEFTCSYSCLHVSVNDGKTKVKTMFTASLRHEIIRGKIQNLGLIPLLDFTVNDISIKSKTRGSSLLIYHVYHIYHEANCC